MFKEVGYGQCSKILNNFLFRFIFIISYGIHKVFFEIANRENPDQIASSEAV